MKKIITMLLGAMLLLCSTVVGAEDIDPYEIKVDPYINYKEGVIEVKLTTGAKFNQALSVVLYQGEEMGDVLANIKQIAATTANEDGKASVDLKLPNNLATGNYVISVYGGGKDDYKGKTVIAYKNADDQKDIVDAINGASSLTDMKNEIEKNKDIFVDAQSVSDGVYEQFISLRRDDFDSHKFTYLNEIVDGFMRAKLLYEIKNITSPTDLLTYLEENTDAFSIDTEYSDYVSSKDKVAAAFINLKSVKALTGYKSFEDICSKALAIGVVNNTDRIAMTDVIKKYANVIGISKNDYEANCSKYGASKVNWAFYGKDFGSTEAIVEAYKKEIEELSKDTGNGSGEGSGGGGGSSSSGTVVYVNTPNTTGADVSVGFSDLSDASWAEDAIKKLAKRGIISGYGDNSFKPNNSVTREEFISIIVRAFSIYDEEASCKFKDVSESDWSYKYIASAAKKKYISGLEDGTFGKGSRITRQDAATIIYRARLANSNQSQSNEIEFTDSEEISEYSKSAITALANAGVINGFEDGSFKPQGSLTRAQAAKMIEALLNL